MNARAERLREALCDLEVEPAIVRADPTGASWLPAALQAWCDADEACREELREFVEAELALLRLSAPEPADPFFTARVVQALPARPVGSRLSPGRRVLVLGGFYAAAGAAAWAVLTRLSGRDALAGAFAQAHALLDAAAPATGYAIAAALLVAVLAVVAFAGGRTHTPVG